MTANEPSPDHWRTLGKPVPMGSVVVGYDPGGIGQSGFAKAVVRDGRIVAVTTMTLEHAEDGVREIERILEDNRVLGIGVDTLTCLSTGRGGWRPADRWLRERYPTAKLGVVAPNGMRGAMCLNGMSVLMAVRQARPDIVVTETHPKVLYYALFGERYDYGARKATMDKDLRECLGVPVEPKNDHEWDAAISILPVICYLRGSLHRDLHALPTEVGERLVRPCGETVYAWPPDESHLHRGPPTLR